jgi:hypothetical protein
MSCTHVVVHLHSRDMTCSGMPCRACYLDPYATRNMQPGVLPSPQHAASHNVSGLQSMAPR